MLQNNSVVYLESGCDMSSQVLKFLEESESPKCKKELLLAIEKRVNAFGQIPVPTKDFFYDAFTAIIELGLLAPDKLSEVTEFSVNDIERWIEGNNAPDVLIRRNVLKVTIDLAKKRFD